jgi:hypothetical protein
MTDGVFSYRNKTFKVDETLGTGIIPPNAKCLILTSPKFGVKVQYRRIVFSVSRFIPPKKKTAVPKKPNVFLPQPDTHYFKYGQSLFPTLVYDQPDHEILKMLEDLFLKKQA